MQLSCIYYMSGLTSSTGGGQIKLPKALFMNVFWVGYKLILN